MQVKNINNKALAYLITLAVVLLAGVGMKYIFDRTNFFSYDYVSEINNTVLRSSLLVIAKALPLIWALFFFKDSLVKGKSFPGRFIPLVGGLGCYYWTISPMALFWSIGIISILAIADFFIRKRKPSKVSILLILLAVFAAIQYLGILNGHYPDAASSAENRLIFLALPVIAIFYEADEEDLDTFILIIFRLFMLFMAFGIVLYFLYSSMFHDSILACFKFNKFYFTTNHIPFCAYDIIYGHIGRFHPTFAYCFFITTFMISLLLARKKRIRITNIELIAYLSIMILYLVTIQSRYGILATLLMTGLITASHFVGKYKPSKKTLLKTIILIIALIIALAAVIIISQEHFFKDNIRLEMISNWKKYYPQKWFWGWGTGSEASVLGIFHCHNAFLSILFTHGIPGLLLLFTIIFSWAYHAVKEKNAVLSTLGIFILLLMTVDAPLNVAYGISMIAIFLIFHKGASLKNIPIR